MNKYLLKYYIKSALIIGFILLVAIICTRVIYFKFKNNNDQINKSESLDVTFHEKNKDKVSITKIAPVTDNVGLSSNSYTFTVKNNTLAKVSYIVKLIPDEEQVFIDNCGEYQIPHNIIKVGYHRNKEKNSIVILDDLKNNILVKRKIAPNSSDDYTIRLWVTNNTLALDSNLHYHGIIQVVEDGEDVATAIE